MTASQTKRRKNRAMNSTAKRPAEAAAIGSGFSWSSYKKASVGVAVVASAALIIALSVTLPAQSKQTDAATTVAVENVSPVIHAQYPHDKTAFTQGLTFTTTGELLESTGLYDGRSSIRRVDLRTGDVLFKSTLSNSLFGEGLTVANGQVFLLTWRSGRGFVYDETTLELIKEFTFSTGTGEGWGITFDGEHLVVSDGSAMLYFWDVTTLTEVRRVQVKERNAAGSDVAVSRLNELEYINGQVWANVWYQNRIVRIDPQTGRVKGMLDCTHLLDGLNADADVFNGVALMPANADATAANQIQIAVTGKFWDTLYVLNISMDDLEG